MKKRSSLVYEFDLLVVFLLSAMKNICLLLQQQQKTRLTQRISINFVVQGIGEEPDALNSCFR